MLREYKTPKQILEETPGCRLYGLMSPEGRMVNWHCGTEPPQGKWCLIYIID